MTEEVKSKSPIQEDIVEKNSDGVSDDGFQKIETADDVLSDVSILSSGEKLLGVLAYISFFFLLPLLMKPKSKFCQLHAKQGMVLTLGYVLLKFVVLFGYTLQVFISLTYFLLAFAGIYFAAQGKMWKYPIIGDFAEKLDFE